MSLSEAKASFTSSEFIEAVAFLDEREWKDKYKWEYYAACMLLRFMQANSSEEDSARLKNARLEDVMIVFRDATEAASEHDREMTPEEIKERQELSEILWRAAMGRGKSKKNKNRKESSSKEEMYKKIHEKAKESMTDKGYISPKRKRGKK